MKRTLPGGFLLALEGIDGAGKSVQARAVGAALMARGLEVVLTREPTNGPWGRRLRESAAQGRLSPEDELHAFLEDRKQHVAELIRPSLETGKVVITDRYYFSTVAYQGARGFDPGELLRMNEAIAIEPHLLVLVDLDPQTSLARIGHRDGRANEFETVAQLARSREIFLSIRKPCPLRLDGRGAPAELRDEILFAFGRAALDRIARNPALSAAGKLAASLAVFGGKAPAADSETRAPAG
jgi:dTMP kinase